MSIEFAKQQFSTLKERAQILFPSQIVVLRSRNYSIRKNLRSSNKFNSEVNLNVKTKRLTFETLNLLARQAFVSPLFFHCLFLFLLPSKLRTLRGILFLPLPSPPAGETIPPSRPPTCTPPRGLPQISSS